MEQAILIIMSFAFLLIVAMANNPHTGERGMSAKDAFKSVTPGSHQGSTDGALIFWIIVITSIVLAVTMS